MLRNAVEDEREKQKISKWWSTSKKGGAESV